MRSSERRSAAGTSARSAELPREVFEQISTPALRTAAQRVACSWQERGVEALGEGEVLHTLAALARALDEGGVEARAEQRTVLHRRLLELLRAEVIDFWRASEASLDPTAMLELMSSFERMRGALEPDWDQYFVDRMTGPEGLDLVMEIAHDLRSPLTSILFLAETLRGGQSGPINEIQHRQLGIIYSAALGLTSVVSDVIELARGGDRLMDKDLSPFSIGEVFAAVREIVQPMAEEKGIVMRLVPPTPDRFLGSPTALSRVLLNLTSNALKFTDEGFVELRAQVQDGARVEFSVRDTGRGIRPEVLRSLYQPFRRTHGRSGYTFSGSGLGLAICRKLVEAMGSDLHVETRPDWGTRFFFELHLPPASTH